MATRVEKQKAYLALRVMDLACEFGIKRAARETGLSRNTVRDLLERQDFMWLGRSCEGIRRARRLLGVRRLKRPSVSPSPLLLAYAGSAPGQTSQMTDGRTRRDDETD